MDTITGSLALASCVQTLTEHMTSLAHTLGTWVQAEPRTLQALEEQIVRLSGMPPRLLMAIGRPHELSGHSSTSTRCGRDASPICC
jgi:hypothetical protein